MCMIWFNSGSWNQCSKRRAWSSFTQLWRSTNLLVLGPVGEETGGVSNHHTPDGLVQGQGSADIIIYYYLKAPEQMFLKQPLEDLELNQMMQFLHWFFFLAWPKMASILVPKTTSKSDFWISFEKRRFTKSWGIPDEIKHFFKTKSSFISFKSF